MKRRPLAVIIALVLLLLLVAGVVYLVDRRSSDPSLTIRKENKDTGEVYYETPNRTPERANRQAEILIFGGYVLTDNDATPAQFSKVKDALHDYSRKNLKNKYDTLTLIPQSFVSEEGVVRGEMRLGDTSIKVKIAIDLTLLTYVGVAISDPSGSAGGGYDSSRLLIDAEFFTPESDYTY